jgi:hypothetical protein
MKVYHVENMYASGSEKKLSMKKHCNVRVGVS